MKLSTLYETGLPVRGVKMDAELTAQREGERPPEKPRLKWAVLLPFSAVIAFVVLLFVYVTYAHQDQDIEKDAQRVGASIQYLYQKGIFDHAHGSGQKGPRSVKDDAFGFKGGNRGEHPHAESRLPAVQFRAFEGKISVDNGKIWRPFDFGAQPDVAG